MPETAIRAAAGSQIIRVVIRSENRARVIAGKIIDPLPS
ncbi:hypothetical protein P775_14005 [Puniceibacterium antarcticum]|uniref:Uncharacterized protein n=1 Tax=Puniceibacterium antarcticum TaxID=1206336 RepID=A0A2G8RDI4_9RHOB|nr:hypothetical protein P775_14005 [Puniceibacterium antarcticum]